MRSYWKRWSGVRPGDVVLDAQGTPRTIHALFPIPDGDGFTVYAEGLSPARVQNEHPCEVVILDATDAVGNLFAAGLNPTPIEERS